MCIEINKAGIELLSQSEPNHSDTEMVEEHIQEEKYVQEVYLVS